MVQMASSHGKAAMHALSHTLSRIKSKLVVKSVRVEHEVVVPFGDSKLGAVLRQLHLNTFIVSSNTTAGQTNQKGSTVDAIRIFVHSANLLGHPTLEVAKVCAHCYGDACAITVFSKWCVSESVDSFQPCVLPVPWSAG